MSAEATSWAWSHAQETESQGQLTVLLALAEHASPEGLCYPKRKTIARMCGFATPGSVTRHVNRLIVLGLVEKNPRFHQHNHVKGEEAIRQTSNEYRLKLELKGVEMGGAVAPPGSAGQGQLGAAGPGDPGSAGATPNEPSVKEPKNEPTDMAEVTQVYEHWMKVFQPERPPKLGPSQVKQIRKGLAEYTADDLCVAFDGLYEWRKRKPGKTSLGAVLDTYPGGKPLVEQIAFFISQAKGATGVGSNFPSADRAIVAEHQRWVLRGHRRSDEPEAVKQAKESELWLYEHGIVVTRPTSDGTPPQFRPRRDTDAPPAS